MTMNQVCTPMWRIDSDGAVMPNLLFHRPWDKLHSRCIEYPFAASHLGEAHKVLDVGTSKSDSIWIEWLSELPVEVYATDYDPPAADMKSLHFLQSDVRNINLSDDSFDAVLAVSVIEHIGLEIPQVNRPDLPSIDSDGDLAAVAELTRILKPGGKLIMTFPFGQEDCLILNNSARCYSLEGVRRFERYLRPKQLDYYEYQHRRYPSLYVEHPRSGTPAVKPTDPVPEKTLPELAGAVTWRRLPLSATRATHHGHVDGILCGIWIKE